MSCLVVIMKLSWIIVIWLIQAHGVGAKSRFASLYEDINFANKFYGKLLMEIYQERSFDSILLLHRNGTEDSSLKAFLQFPVPKLDITQNRPLAYKDFYNSEILVVIITQTKLDYEIMETAAKSLNYMRQTRILMIAENIVDEGLFKEELLSLCHLYKMTNALLSFDHLEEGKDIISPYFQLKPYPKYHWLSLAKDMQLPYFPEHWRNFHNRTLKTYIEVTSSRGFYFKDHQDQLHISGSVAMMVLLFAERCNGRLEWLDSQMPGNSSPFSVTNEMVDEGLIDVPMAVTPLTTIAWPRNTTYTFEINPIAVMVPKAKQFTVQEIYGKLVNGHLFLLVFLVSMCLGATHVFIEYFWYKSWNICDLIIHSRILPGVIGLSFPARPVTDRSLKLVYILLGFIGLYIATLFSATNNTLFTSPPTHSEIRTFEDLEKSSLQILYLEKNVAYSEHILGPIKNNLLLLTDEAYGHDHLNSLNTSYGYPVTSNTWDISWRLQKFTSSFTFHRPKDMVLDPLIPWSYKLQYNSPYLEPLNYYIHQVHALGLDHAWRDRIFYDLLRQKAITMQKPKISQGPEVLRVGDL
ncbi:uncharacterized protein LOC142224462 [Haematobia irritans]|uniref:uncharacterized protein LOC142224462 n=1 Tax=Haematobia irritans TaxID=7368 RepID=UPI003F50524B